MKSLLKLGIVVALIVVGVKEGSKKYEEFVYQDEVKILIRAVLDNLKKGSPPDMQLAQSYWLLATPQASMGQLSSTSHEFKSFYRQHHLKKMQDYQVDNIVVERTPTGELVGRVKTRIDGKPVVFLVSRGKKIKYGILNKPPKI